jgi:galactose mutarotase-like enzyme
MPDMTSPSSLETVVLTSGTARVFVAPERGGMATRFVVGERPVFFLDEATLRDRSKNVRGGNPVLFPSPGKLEGDRFEQGGRSGAMTQHGFGRNHPWTITAQKEDEVTLRLAANATTRAAYPWDFVVTFRYALKGQALRIEQRFETESDAPMPFGAGVHPYFQVAQPQKALARIPTRAIRAWDNTKKTMVDLLGRIDLTGAEVDLHLVGHGADSATLDLGDGHRIEVRASAEYRHWIVWTLGGRDFVCLEPWTCAANALNTGEDLLRVRRGEPVELWTEIAFH